MNNSVTIEFDSLPSNEGFARVAVAAFMTQMNPTLEEISDVKTAVSEAVTNAVIHAYEKERGLITVKCNIDESEFMVTVIDKGCGIDDVDKAMEPMFTSKPEMERSGMGFSFMGAFMDEIDVKSKKDHGTTVTMKKILGKGMDYKE